MFLIDTKVDFSSDLELKNESKHSRMRRQSSALVTATDKNSAVGVLFAVDYDVIVRKPCFQRGSTLKFLKNFRTFYCEISVQRHGVIISVQPIRMQLRRGCKSIFSPCFSGLFTSLCFEQSCRVAFALVYLCFEGAQSGRNRNFLLLVVARLITYRANIA